MIKTISLDFNSNLLEIQVGHGILDLESSKKGIYACTDGLSDERLMKSLKGFVDYSIDKFLDKNNRKYLAEVTLTDERDAKIIELRNLIMQLQQDQRQLYKEREQAYRRKVKSINRVK